MAQTNMFKPKNTSNPYERYSDSWFKYEYPEYIKAFTHDEWLKLFRQHNPREKESLVTAAVDNCVRIYGVREDVNNEFGPVCP